MNFLRGGSGRTFAFVSVLLVIAVTLAPPMQRYFAQKAQINALKAQLNDSELTLTQAEDELAQWNDPKYVASQARSRLHYVYPGERQYIVLGVPNSNEQNTAQTSGSNRILSGIPWYSKVIASITSANNTP